MSAVPTPETDAWTDAEEEHNQLPARNAIAVSEIEQRGLRAVDDLLRRGPVHVVGQGHPGYVVMTEALFDEWLDELNEAHVARVQAAMADVAAGHVHRYETTDEMMEAIRQYRDADE